MTFIVRRTAGRNHYYVDADVHPRHRVPGVTTIGKAMQNRKLENYASSATADYAVNNWETLSAMPPASRLHAIMGGRWDKRNAGADLGTAIHRFGERLLVGEPVDVPPDMRGYVDSYVRFMDRSEIEAEHIEVPCYSATHAYAGTIDIMGDLILPDTEVWEDVARDEEGRSYGALDPKSGGGVYESAALQLVAYVHSERLITAGATSFDRALREEIETPAVDFAAALHIHPDGTTATLVRTDCSDAAFRKWLYLRQVYDLQQTADELLYPPTPYPWTSAQRAPIEYPEAEPDGVADVAEPVAATDGEAQP